MACIVCGSAKMARSHIFPRALVHEMKDGEPVVHSVDRNKTGYKNSQSGPWEPDILSESCEAKLSGCDNYAVRWVRRFDQDAVPILGGKAFDVPNPKPDLLVQFAGSVLWRASVARHNRNTDIDLGPWEPLLRAAVFEKGEFQPKLFLARKRYVTDGVFHGSVVVQPYHAPDWSRRSYVFELSNLLWGLKLDNRRGGDTIFDSPVVVNGKTTAIVINMGDAELSQQHEIMEIFAAAEGLVWNP